jgi:hypothetical protein
MRIRLLILLVALVPSLALTAQTPLPPDINPVTLSRLPPVTSADLGHRGHTQFR